MRGLLLASAFAGQALDTAATGIVRAMADRGIDMVPARSGPGSDGSRIAFAARAPVVDLDSWCAGRAQLRARAAMRPGEMLLIAGHGGLLDAAPGSPPGGAGSDQRLAEVLDVPVVLILDIAAMAQGAVAVAEGMQQRSGRIAGLVLTGAASDAHVDIVRRAIGDIVPILGVLRVDALPGRSQQPAADEAAIASLAEVAGARVGIDRLIALATRVAPAGGPPTRLPAPGRRIAFAQGNGLPCWHVLEDWRAQGAEIATFAPGSDQGPPLGADAVFLPDVFGEADFGVIARAEEFRSAMRAALDRGVPIIGEGTGFALLARGVACGGAEHQMLGFLEVEVALRPARHLPGYRRLEPQAGPWATTLFGHDDGRVEMTRSAGSALFRALDAMGRELGTVGVRAGTVMGSPARVLECAPAATANQLGGVRLGG